MGLPALRGASEEPEEGTPARTERTDDLRSDDADSETLTRVRMQQHTNSNSTNDRIIRLILLSTLYSIL